MKLVRTFKLTVDFIDLGVQPAPGKIGWDLDEMELFHDDIPEGFNIVKLGSFEYLSFKVEDQKYAHLHLITPDHLKILEENDAESNEKTPL